MELGHSTSVDCIWDGGTAPIQATGNSTITRGIVRNATAGGLTLTGAPGNYTTKLDATFTNNTTFDIALGSGGTGTYNLAGVKVNSGYTLKIHNNSANAITVQVPAGINTSTAGNTGGAITIESPQLTTTIAAQVSLVGAEVRIYDLDNSPAGSLGSDVVAGVESCPTSTFSFSTAAGNSVWVQIMLDGYKEFGQQLTAPSASTTFTFVLTTETDA